MENEILTVNHAVKRFGGLTALDDASIHVNKGEIVGLIGPNGAGKTTMFNAIDGVFRLTSGTVHFKGEDISALPPNKRCLLGIGRTFQITKPFGGMTVLENVAVGAMFGKNSSENILSSKLMRQSMEYAEEVLKKNGLLRQKECSGINTERAGTQAPGDLPCLGYESGFAPAGRGDCRTEPVGGRRYG